MTKKHARGGAGRQAGGSLFDAPEQVRDFFFAMLESLPGAILLSDRQGGLLAMNQRAIKLLGMAGTPLSQQNCWSLLASRFGLGEEAAVLRFPGGRLLCEVPAVAADEEDGRRQMLISRNDLESPFLDVAGFFLSLEDVTFPALLEAQRGRRQRFAAMQEMAEAMSQELKNPLGGIELYASILRRELAEDPDNERLAARMLGAIRTMNHLLDNFVALSGFPQARMEPIDLAGLLRGVARSLAQTAKETGGTVKTRIVDAEVVTQGDPALLGQLFLHLGTNGLEAMPAGGVLSVSMRLLAAGGGHGPLAEVVFRDQGEGIAPEAMARIFDPFYSTKGQGRGLGLAIAHYVAEAHQGLIEAESQPGRGSVFRVLLPVGQG
ncbi:MAG: two-component system sensor histidine kinase NtrB [Thermodesulfobacteriota bacterium]